MELREPKELKLADGATFYFVMWEDRTTVYDDEMYTMFSLSGHYTPKKLREIVTVAMMMYNDGIEVGKAQLRKDLKDLLNV